jgi:pimeloyl-ACP methyl ester carboxylesterase
VTSQSHGNLGDFWTRRNGDDKPMGFTGAFSFEGQAIAWGVIGEGSPAVVVHGSPFSSREWRRIAPWLALHRRVFYYDLLGYGQLV